MMVTAALFITVKNWKEFKGSSTIKQINKMWHIRDFSNENKYS